MEAVVDGFRFSVTPEAAIFIDRVVLANEPRDHYVVTIAPHTRAEVLDLVDGSLTQTIVELLRNVQADPRQVDPTTMKFRWVVGASLRARFPPEDIHVFDGVACFVPNEMRPVLDGRTLTLRDSELRIEPEPPAPAAR